ncbi:MAG: FAD-dependent oxidoreductase [Pseudomonadota bacterium]
MIPPKKPPSIFVCDLRLSGRVGVYPTEHKTEQTVLVDVHVGVEDLSLAAQTEKLNNTLNYEDIARLTREVVSRRRYRLVETLATSIAEEVLLHPRALWVRVRLRKLDCIPYASSAGVEVELTRENKPSLPKPILATKLRNPEDVAIVGGGVAGLGASLWCSRLGIPSVVIDPSLELGGQLHLVNRPMVDLPGMEPMTGKVLANNLQRQFVGHEGRWYQDRLTKIETTQDGCTLHLETLSISSRAVILATGLRRRRLNVPGEDTLLGHGILVTATQNTEQIPNTEVLIVGGGDAACENALLLAQTGRKVLLVHRGSRLSARKQFCTKIENNPQITVRLETQVCKFIGERHLEEVVLSDPSGKHRMAIQVALVRIGWEPNTECFPRSWLDEKGFLSITNSCLVKGETVIFAAGDTASSSWSVISAMGSGACAAQSAAKKLGFLN